MRIRPIRPYIYKPVLWFGIPLLDWIYIVPTVFISYSIPFFLDLQIGNIPVPLVTGVLSFVISVGFFNWARIGRKPMWLHHNVIMLMKTRFLTRPYKKRRRLPLNRKKRMEWILDAAERGALDWMINNKETTPFGY